MYVIERTDQGGGFAMPPGQEASYTHDLRLARTFTTREQAQIECCPDNEIPRSVESLLRTPERVRIASQPTQQYPRTPFHSSLALEQPRD